MPDSEDVVVLARRPDLKFDGPVVYERFDANVRKNLLGTWSLELPWDGDPGSVPSWLLTPGAGVAFAIRNTIWMSGPITTPVEELSSDGQLSLMVGGIDELRVCADRLTYPEPTLGDPPFTGATNGGLAHDIRGDGTTTTAEKVIKEYVDVNAGPGAHIDRETPGLAIATNVDRGSFVGPYNARLQPLLEWVGRIADDGGLGLRCVQTAAGVLTFDVYATADKSALVKFAVSLGNVASYTATQERPTVTYVVVGGGDELIARAWAFDSVASSWGRIEGWRDQRHTTDSTELSRAAAEVLAEGAERLAIAATVIDTGAHQWAPVADDPLAETWEIGDQVTLVLRGTEYVQPIQEAHIMHEAGGPFLVEPVVGTPNPLNPRDRDDVLAAFLELRRRIDYGEKG